MSSFEHIVFVYDHNGRLIKLEIAFHSPSFERGYDPSADTGYMEAYQEICDVVSERLGGYTCMLQDYELYQASVEHYKQIRLEALK